MLEGRIGETAAMRAALLRAEARAKRAFYMEPLANPVDIEEARKVMKEVRWVVEVLENILS